MKVINVLTFEVLKYIHTLKTFSIIYFSESHFHYHEQLIQLCKNQCILLKLKNALFGLLLYIVLKNFIIILSNLTAYFSSA